jgi:hypothetical protein
MKSLLVLVCLFVSLVLAAPLSAAAPAVVELFEDEADELIPQLVNESGEAGVATREDGDSFSGLCCLRVTPLQRYTAQVKGWAFPIVEKPGPGQYRYIRFAWKKSGGRGIMLQLCGNTDVSGWGHRYVAGVQTVQWESLKIVEQMPEKWEVMTRDLVKDFRPFTLTGIAFTPMDGTAGLYDHVYLGGTVEDLDRVTDAALGKVRVKAEPTAEQLQGWWQDLLSRDALAWLPAASLLGSAPEQSVPFLRERLKKQAPGDEERRIAKLIKDLDDDEFSIREAASQELAKLGAASVPHLEKAYRETESLEVRERVRKLLGRRPGSGELTAEERRLLRCVRVLDQAGTSAAKELLESLTASEDARLKREARAALARLTRRSPDRP